MTKGFKKQLIFSDLFAASITASTTFMIHMSYSADYVNDACPALAGGK